MVEIPLQLEEFNFSSISAAGPPPYMVLAFLFSIEGQINRNGAVGYWEYGINVVGMCCSPSAMCVRVFHKVKGVKLRVCLCDDENGSAFVFSEFLFVQKRRILCSSPIRNIRNWDSLYEQKSVEGVNKRVHFHVEKSGSLGLDFSYHLMRNSSGALQWLVEEAHGRFDCFQKVSMMEWGVTMMLPWC